MEIYWIIIIAIVIYALYILSLKWLMERYYAGKAGKAENIFFEIYSIFGYPFLWVTNFIGFLIRLFKKNTKIDKNK